MTEGNDDDEVEAEEMPGGARWVVGEVGDKWRRPGEDDQLPGPGGRRGDSKL